MIELKDKVLIKKKNEVDEYIKVANSTRYYNDKAMDLAIDKYIEYFREVFKHLEEQVDDLFKEKYISDDKYILSPYITNLLNKVNRDLNKNIVKAKLSSNELIKIKRTINRIKNIKQEVLIYNDSYINDNFKSFEDKYKDIISNIENIDLKQINISKEIYIDPTKLTCSTNDKILNKKEEYPYEEERRLFYVAMTRCKKDVFFMVENDIKSEFIEEIKVNHLIIKDNRYYDKKNICPKCLNGRIIEKIKVKNSIKICTNYPICNYVEHKNL